MAGKFLDKTGVETLWQKIKTALNGKANSSHTHTISQITDLKKGQANGVASLDSSGKVPSSQLPAGSSGGLSYECLTYGISGTESYYLDISDVIAGRIIINNYVTNPNETLSIYCADEHSITLLLGELSTNDNISSTYSDEMGILDFQNGLYILTHGTEDNLKITTRTNSKESNQSIKFTFNGNSSAYIYLECFLIKK